MNRLNWIINENIFDLVNLKSLIIINDLNDKFNENKNSIFSIPSSFSNNLKNLKEFTVRGVDLKIVLIFSELISESLEILDLSYNRIYGNFTVSELIKDKWKSKKYLSKLKVFDISNNKINAIIDDLVLFPNSLEIIKLNNNFIKGSFPYLESQVNLKIFDMRNNSLTGEVNVIYIFCL